MIDTRAEFDDRLWNLLAPITTCVFAVIVLLLAYSAVRGRGRLGDARAGAPRLELADAGALGAAVLVMLGFSFAAESRVGSESSSSSLRRRPPATPYRISVCSGWPATARTSQSRQARASAV